MSDWYVSSAAYAALPQWAASHAYNIGDIIRPLTPVANQAFVYRCTTAGTSTTTEPTWSSAVNNNTTTGGTPNFTNVTGQSAFGW